MKRLLAVLVLLLPQWSFAQNTGTSTGIIRYDLSSAAVIYCAGGQWTSGPGLITTSGSSTTVTAVAGSTPFDAVVAPTSGASSAIQSQGFVRKVSAKASTTSITVDSAVNLGTGTGWSFINFLCGTTANDGWMDVSKYNASTLVFELNTINATSIEARWECVASVNDASPTIVYPGEGATCGGGTLASGYCSFTAADILAVVVNEPWSRCRIGMKISTDTGAQSINTYMIGRNPR